MSSALISHLKSGHTTVCRCWRIVRTDGETLGFTDHDGALEFDGTVFMPETGLTATAIAQSTGLSIDNSEALGALRSDAISEDDLVAGRYDRADVTAWLVNWQDVSERMIQFRGQIGEITRSAGAFVAELRGLAETLNKAQGAVYQRQCSAILGDGACGLDMSATNRSAEVVLTSVEGGISVRFADPVDIEKGHLVRGRLVVVDGQAAGLIGIIKAESTVDGERNVALWQSLGAGLVAGDRVRVEVGCDKTATTCKARFANFANFRGFPHIPGDDWLMAYPSNKGGQDGGSLFGDEQ